MSNVSRPRFRKLAPHTLRELADSVEKKDVKSIIITWINKNGRIQRCSTVDDPFLMISALELAKLSLINHYIGEEEDD